MINRLKKFYPYFFILLLVILFLASQSRSYSAIKSRILDGFSLPLKIANFPLQEIKKILFYRSIHQENSRLNNQIDSLKRRLVNQEEILQENERLKKLLSFKNKSPFSLIAAKVIARDASNWESVAIIDKGSSDGIREGMAAITELGLVGKVLDVGKNSSKIILVNDPNFNVAALLQRSREEAIVSGTINGICRMKYLSLDTDAKAGDVVITSGLSQDFPKGVLIGYVVDVDTDTSGLAKNCIVQPAVKLSRLEEVLLVLP